MTPAEVLRDVGGEWQPVGRALGRHGASRRMWGLRPVDRCLATYSLSTLMTWRCVTDAASS